jgi:hypothetical protein
MEVNGQLHIPAAVSPGEKASGTHHLGGWVSPITGMDAVLGVETLPNIKAIKSKMVKIT